MDQKSRSSLAPAIVAALLVACGLACGFSLSRRWDPWVEVCRLSMPVDQAAFSPDERQVATWPSGGTRGQVFFWDAQTGVQLRELEFPPPADRFIGFSPDLNIAVFEASGPGNEEHTLLRFASGGPDQELPTSLDNVVFSPDGTTLATISEGSGIRLWNARTGELIRVVSTMASHRGAFLPDGQSIVSFESFDGEQWGGLKLRTLPGGKEVWKVPFPWVTEIRVSSDGQRILAVGGKGAATIYSSSTGEVLTELSGVGTGHFVPKSDLVLSASGSCLQGTTRALDARTGKAVFEPPWKVHVSRSLTVSPSGKYLLLGDDATGSGAPVIIERRRPENLWGIARLWECWALVMVACCLLALGFYRAAVRHHS